MLVYAFVMLYGCFMANSDDKKMKERSLDSPGCAVPLESILVYITVIVRMFCVHLSDSQEKIIIAV